MKLKKVIKFFGEKSKPYDYFLCPECEVWIEWKKRKKHINSKKCKNYALNKEFMRNFNKKIRKGGFKL